MVIETQKLTYTTDSDSKERSWRDLGVNISAQINAPHSDYLFKLVIVGDSGAGKTALLLRFADDTFTEDYLTTIGVDFRFRTVRIDEHSVKLQIVGFMQWDTAGQERFRTITSAYYRGANGIIIVFDKSNPDSFQHVSQWLQDVNRYTDDSTIKLAIGNKSDLESKVDAETAIKQMQELGLPYIETSAKSAAGVEAAFLAIARALIVKAGPPAPVVPLGAKVSLPDVEGNKKSACCSYV